MGVTCTAYRPPFVTARRKYEADPFCRGGVDGLWVILACNVGRARDRGQVSTGKRGPAAALSLQRSDDGCHMYRLQAAVCHRKA
jgi:hypothetical protein